MIVHEVKDHSLVRGTGHNSQRVLICDWNVSSWLVCCKLWDHMFLMCVLCVPMKRRSGTNKILRKYPSFHPVCFAGRNSFLTLGEMMMHGMCQRGGPSGWSRGRSFHCEYCGGLGGRELLPKRAAVCAEPRAGRSHSGPPLPASCWWGGRMLHSEGGSPPPRRCSEPTAAETAARQSWHLELPGRRLYGADGAAGGCCGRAKEP